MADRKIKFVFEGDTRDLERALGTVRKEAGETGAEVTTAGAESASAWDDFTGAMVKAKGPLIAIGVAAAAATVALAATVVEAVRLSDEANQIAKSARAIGASTADLQLLQGAMDLLTDGSVDAGRAIQDLQRGLAEARDGAGPAKDALEKLGLTASDLAGLPVAEQVATIADKMGRLEDVAERTQVAMDVFGRSGRGMAAALGMGGDAIREATGAIEDAGIISAETAAESEGLQDAILLAGKAFETLKRDAVEPLLPVLAAAADKAAELMRAFADTGIPQAFGRAVAFVAEKLLGLTGEVQEFKDAVDDAQAAERTLTDEYNAQSDAVTRLRGEMAALEDKERRLGEERVRALSLSQSVSRIDRELVETAEARAAAAGVLRTEVAMLTSFEAQLVREMEREARAADAARAAEERRRELLSEPAPEGGGGLSLDEIKGQLAEEEEVRLDAQERMARAQIEIEENLQAELTALRDAELEANLESIEARKRAEDELLAKREQAATDAMRATMAMTSSIVSLTGAVTDAVIEGQEEGTQARKDAAMAGFVIMKIAAVAEAAVATALSIVNSLAAGLPVGAILAVAAGIAGAAATAAIIAQPPPSFHAGGLITGAVSAPDEVQIRALRGETVVTEADTRAAGGAAGVRDAVRGGGSRQIVIVNQVGPKVVDAQTHEALRTGTGTLAQQFRAVRPRKVGRRNPYEGT